MKPWLYTVAAAVLCGCCASPPAVELIDTDAISAVQNNVDVQVGAYIVASRGVPKIKVAEIGADGKKVLVSTPISELQVPAEDPNRNVFACGTGNLNFEISSVQLQLATSQTDIYGVGGGATIPVHMVTLSGKAGETTTVSNVQTGQYEVWPLEPKDQTNLVGADVSSKALHQYPIAETLVSIREALIGSDTRYDYTQIPPRKRDPKPCFTDYNPLKPLEAPHDIYTLALTTTYDTNVGLTVSVSVLSLGANGEWKSTTGNTLTVAFQQPGLEAIAAAQAAVDAKCKTSLSSKPCKVAQDQRKRISDDLNKIGVFAVHQTIPDLSTVPASVWLRINGGGTNP